MARYGKSGGNKGSAHVSRTKGAKGYRSESRNEVKFPSNSVDASLNAHKIGRRGTRRKQMSY